MDLSSGGLLVPTLQENNCNVGTAGRSASKKFRTMALACRGQPITRYRERVVFFRQRGRGIFLISGIPRRRPDHRGVGEKLDVIKRPVLSSHPINSPNLVYWRYVWDGRSLWGDAGVLFRAGPSVCFCHMHLHHSVRRGTWAGGIVSMVCVGPLHGRGDGGRNEPSIEQVAFGWGRRRKNNSRADLGNVATTVNK